MKNIKIFPIETFQISQKFPITYSNKKVRRKFQCHIFSMSNYTQKTVIETKEKWIFPINRRNTNFPLRNEEIFPKRKSIGTEKMSLRLFL